MESINLPDIQSLILFFASIGYALFLQWWWRNYPQSFTENTWLTVVIGVGYVLLALKTRFVLEDWWKICEYFIFAGIPIIIRSLILHAINQRDAEGIPVRKGDGQQRTKGTARKKEMADGSQPPPQGGDS